MIKPIRTEPEANEELLAAARWYERRCAGLGMEFLATIGVALDLIQRHPSSGSPVPKVRIRISARRVVLHRFPYAVIFLELETEIRVLAFAHHRQRPGYWIRRVPA